MDTPKVYCAYTEMVATGSLVEKPRNPNKHAESQIIAPAKIIRHQGWRNPIVVSALSLKGMGVCWQPGCLARKACLWIIRSMLPKR